MNILRERTAGILLPVTALPGPHGIGDLGPDAFRFVDWLAGCGQRLWQVLPTVPIGPGDSPYQSVSAFAGSPLMVSLERLAERGWLAAPTLPPGGFDPLRVDYGCVAPWRLGRLREAHAGFLARATDDEARDFAAYCRAQAGWLDDYALFMALETATGDLPWWDWEAGLRHREPAALARARQAHAAEAGFWQFVQWCFDTQWAALKAHANGRGVRLLADLPIFVAHHSADCWARPDLYHLGDDDQPTVVAGVPPDDLGPDGQRWGNPLYRWDRMARDGYAWWTARVARALAHADAFRIDHFLGFHAYWEIPAASPTALAGHWVPGPGRAVFDAIAAQLGELPIVAEDLGLVTPAVHALREACGFPGMRVLQFAFGTDATNPYLPHNHQPDALACTGTHDTRTVRGWWDAASPRERAFAGSYLAATRDDIHWAMIRAACNSVARTAVFPLQDVLGLDDRHRTNVPGTPTGNWTWRFAWDWVTPEHARVLGLITAASGRGPFRLLAAGA